MTILSADVCRRECPSPIVLIPMEHPMKLAYQIDDFTLEVEVDPNVGFTTGEDIVFTTEHNDLALEQD